MTTNGQVVLITGGNAGIGFGLAELLLEDPSKHVIIGSRSTGKGDVALKELQALNRPGSIDMLQLDVTDEKSIAAAVHRVDAKHGRLDALVNNAAIGSFSDDKASLSDEMRQVFETNCIGVQMVTDAFAPLLKKCTSIPRIINVSSGGGPYTPLIETYLYQENFILTHLPFCTTGSIGMRREPELYARCKDLPPAIAYRSSKAALNMIHAIQATDYGELGWKVFCYAPGFTVSNLSHLNTKEYGAKPTADGARPMVSLLNGERDDKHGCFLESQGGEHPW